MVFVLSANFCFLIGKEKDEYVCLSNTFRLEKKDAKKYGSCTLHISINNTLFQLHS
jgi:hypothetical protein